MCLSKSQKKNFSPNPRIDFFKSKIAFVRIKLYLSTLHWSVLCPPLYSPVVSASIINQVLSHDNQTPICVGIISLHCNSRCMEYGHSIIFCDDESICQKEARILSTFPKLMREKSCLPIFIRTMKQWTVIFLHWHSLERRVFHPAARRTVQKGIWTEGTWESVRRNMRIRPP